MYKLCGYVFRVCGVDVFCWAACKLSAILSLGTQIKQYIDIYLYIW